MRADVFCRVIDNYGDAGVGFRLARQLVAEHGFHVRLFIDQPAALDQIAPVEDRLDGMQVLSWDAYDQTPPAWLIVATFSCRLPQPYMARMVTMPRQPVWINLEYLSAEHWVDTHHKLPSRQPGTRLTEHFFFPGFTTRTGGLLRERDVLQRMEHAQSRAAPAQRLRVSVFAYPSPSLDGLMDAVAASPQPVEIVVPHGKVSEYWQLHAERTIGSATLVPIPMLPHPQYDALLATCDLNIVRGEDSFVRAHWAGAPFVWHVYPQSEQTHLRKLDAWLHVFASQVPTAQPIFALIARFHRAWNTDDAQEVRDLWPQLLGALPAWRDAVSAFRSVLCAQPDCTAQLIEFAKELGFGLE